ncbi:hypothetical protein FZ103_00655 [Streptomonospora sp. PA3]|uniref:hypothetical protein n=1 Tax=Streptomonospora sp. PA3 TaxID=2607326 RepID=UPI0012DE7418|nr:hypothetical protein [Streptomonospora sp. PA3]MUL39702.1 hypothetical protein [Streptomonospora sp. PA3]
MADTTEQPVSQWHWIITVQYPAPTGIGMDTRSGTWGAQPGGTRGEAFDQILTHVAEQLGLIQRPHVLFFALEPNAL